MSASTVFELEAEGYTHVARLCRDCLSISTLSFGDVRERAGNGPVWASTLAKLSPILRCEECAGGAVELTAQKLARIPRGGPKTPIERIRNSRA